MKELSTEQKAQKYDEVVKRAKVEKEKSRNLGLLEFIDENFPELADSEDEKIRKALIGYFTLSDEHAYNEACGVSYRDIVAWLEKQDDPIDINPSEFNLRLNKLLKQFETLSKEELASSLAFYLNVIQNDGTYKSDEKQCGQKLVDKVEPKFHEGEWVFIEEVRGYKNGPFRIKIVDSFGYSFDEYHIIPFMYEDLLSKWTIQDAKDGDVLACESGWTCIFKKLNHNSFGGLLFDSYCFIDRTGWFCDGAKGHTLDERINGKIYPATKEQRDLLFTKMKETGYEWDAEKRELKKIEQKPVYSEDRNKELSLSLQIQAYLNTASDELYAKGKSLYSEKRLEDIHKCMLMWQKLHNAYFYQKTTEWSEEDEETLDYIIDYIKKQKSKDTIHTKRTEVLEGMIVWLKSLKHQKQFITDEELAQAKKEAYNDALNKIEYHSGEPTFDDGWSAAIWYLKKRNTIPQSQWKPSEEQITWLYRAADEASRDSRMKQILNELLSDLKKLRNE